MKRRFIPGTVASVGPALAGEFAAKGLGRHGFLTLRLIRLASYRCPLPVTRFRSLANGDCYPVCPRCDSSLDREYTQFCDRCGQRLAWPSLTCSYQD